MRETELEILGRVNALLFLVQNSYAAWFMQGDDPVGGAEAFHREAVRRIRKGKSEGAYRIVTAAIVAETERAMDATFAEIRRDVATELRRRESKA